MNNVKIYNTKQKSLIKDLFVNNPNEYFTADQLLSILVCDKKLVSKATLYRTLDALISNGEVIKYNVGNNSSCYQYSNCKKDSHIHFRCQKCGIVLHINNPLMDKMASKIGDEYGVKIDNKKTILYGYCQDCGGDE